MAIEGTTPEQAGLQGPVTIPPMRRLMVVPSRLPIPSNDWQTLVATRVNTVVIGREDAALRVWTAVWPSLQKPIHWADGDNLLLPRDPAGTLILQDADRLTSSAQQQLFAWLHDDVRATRVLTTTTRALFPMVEEGAFHAGLYYRLNVLLLEL